MAYFGFIANHTEYRIKTKIKRVNGKPELFTYLLKGKSVLLENIATPETRSRELLEWGRKAIEMSRHLK